MSSWKVKKRTSGKHANPIEDQGEKLVQVLQILKPANNKYKINWKHVTKTSAINKIIKELSSFNNVEEEIEKIDLRTNKYLKR